MPPLCSRAGQYRPAISKQPVTDTGIEPIRPLQRLLIIQAAAGRDVPKHNRAQLRLSQQYKPLLRLDQRRRIFGQLHGMVHHLAKLAPADMLER
ncbi:hypothetical protein D3C84_1025910 [compost metagenome]